MASIRSLLKTLFDQFIHKDFHEAVANMTLIDAFLFLVITKTLPYNASLFLFQVTVLYKLLVCMCVCFIFIYFLTSYIFHVNIFHACRLFTPLISWGYGLDYR